MDIFSMVFLLMDLPLYGVMLGKRRVAAGLWFDVAVRFVFMVGMRIRRQHMIFCTFTSGLGLWSK